MGVMRYVIAVMLMWGGFQFSYGQDYTSSDPDCPPTSTEATTGDLSDDPMVSTEYEYDSDQSSMDSEAEIESDAGIMDGNCPNDASTTVNVIEVAPVAVEVVEVEKEHSTFGKIWRSPFKLIGNIPKATVSIVSETAEGVGHIVGAPFKGVGKLFGKDEKENNDVAKAEEKYNKDLNKADEEYYNNLEDADSESLDDETMYEEEEM